MTTDLFYAWCGRHQALVDRVARSHYPLTHQAASLVFDLEHLLAPCVRFDRRNDDVHRLRVTYRDATVVRPDTPWVAVGDPRYRRGGCVCLLWVEAGVGAGAELTYRVATVSDYDGNGILGKHADCLVDILTAGPAACTRYGPFHPPAANWPYFLALPALLADFLRRRTAEDL